MAGNSGDGSYSKLFKNIYGLSKTESFIQKYTEYKINIRPDQIFIQLFSLIMRSGWYNSQTGMRSSRIGLGDYWEKTTSQVASVYASNLRFYETDINLQRKYDAKSLGMSLRCVAK